jgi:2-methylisocitrate lyase-like PEP mutase family enzyme
MQGAVPIADLQRAGVKRISMGVALYTRVMADLRAAARQLAAGDTAAATAGISFREILRMIAEAGQGSRER